MGTNFWMIFKHHQCLSILKDSYCQCNSKSLSTNKHGEDCGYRHMVKVGVFFGLL